MHLQVRGAPLQELADPTVWDDPCLNAPTGAWCSLTMIAGVIAIVVFRSQCTYRCVVLPDPQGRHAHSRQPQSQCTYRCVVLPDGILLVMSMAAVFVSMHLQVRGAP